MKFSKPLYGLITILGIIFLALLFSTILQDITHGTMMTNGLRVKKAEFHTVSGNNSVISLSIENIGDSSFVLRVARVNRVDYEISGSNVTIAGGASCIVEIILTSGNYWVVGDNYEIKLYDSNNFDRSLLASYQATATPFTKPTPSPKPEPFPTTLAITSIVATSVIITGILVYFKKYKKT